MRAIALTLVSGIHRAGCAASEQIMFARDDVLEESLCILELSALRANLTKSSLDRCCATRFATVQDDTYLGETHPDALGCLTNLHRCIAFRLDFRLT